MSFEIIMQHCLTHLSSHQVMLIGGIIVDKNEADFYYSHKTVVYDFLVNTWTSGPEMSVGRANHGCTSFTDKDDINWTIVFGGVISFDGDSVINKLTQMLKENSSEWTDMEMNYLCMQIGISPYTNNALSLIILWVKLCLLKA